MFFWNGMDLERKLEEFRTYYNQLRVHQSLQGATPSEKSGGQSGEPIPFEGYRWQRHCGGLFELPIAA
jgi:hypothetical protein